MVPYGECRNAAWFKKGFYQLLDLSPLIPPADLQLSEEVTFFLGWQGKDVLGIGRGISDSTQCREHCTSFMVIL